MVLEERSPDTLDCQKDEQWVLEQINLETPLEVKMANLKLFPAHSEKARFFGKDNNAGENGRQEEKRKTRYEVY